MADGPARKGKKRKVLTYEEEQKAKDLEEFLFGADPSAVDAFGSEAAPAAAAAPDADGARPLFTLADLVREAGEDAAQLAGQEDEGDGAGAAAQAAAWEDRRGSGAAAGVSGAADGGETLSAAASRRRPVWEDPDDQEALVDVAAAPRLRKLRQAEEERVINGKEYEARLRQQHARLNPRTAWAQSTGRRPRKADGSDAESDEEEDAGAALLSSAGALLGRSARLPPGLIETTRLKDGNQAEPSGAVVRSVEFHPLGQLLMTAGFDKKLRFFAADGAKNAHVASVHLDDLPIAQAAFANGGSQVVAAGRRKHFYVLDVAAGKPERIVGLVGCADKSLETFAAARGEDNPLVAFFGNAGSVPLVSLRSRQAVGALRMSGSVRCGAFSADGLELLTSGGDGVIHTWDLRMRRCVRRDADEGCLNASSLALAPDGRMVASGSSSGVVNIYERPRSSLLGADLALQALGSVRAPAPAPAPVPLRALMNLTTNVDSLAFSPDSQILAMASRMKRDALRLVHLPSCTVFSNWPTSRSPLGHVHALSFSPRGGMLAVGNAKGRVLLYRLHHYPEM